MKTCIGLTGGIASGKSTVLQYCLNKGYEIFSADAIAKQLTIPNTAEWNAIVEYFGNKILQSNQEINRKLLREIIFNDPKQKLWLENILHPAIRNKLENLVSQTTKSHIIIEIPLLTKRNDYPYLTKIIAIVLSLEQQIQRIMLRDNCSQTQALAIINNQPSQKNYADIADYVLTNNDNIELLYSKLDEILAR